MYLVVLSLTGLQYEAICHATESLVAEVGNKRARALEKACSELSLDPPASVYKRMLAAVMLSHSVIALRCGCDIEC